MDDWVREVTIAGNAENAVQWHHPRGLHLPLFDFWALGAHYSYTRYTRLRMIHGQKQIRLPGANPGAKRNHLRLVEKESLPDTS